MNNLKKRLRSWKPIHLCWLFDKYGLPIPRYLIGGGDAAPQYEGSRISNATRVWEEDEDVNVTGWVVGTDFCISVGWGTQSGKRCNSREVRLRWRNVTDLGSFADLGSSGELTYSAVTDLENDTALTEAESGLVASQTTFDQGMEREGANAWTFPALGGDDWTACMWAVDTDNAHAGDTYEFELYNQTDGAQVGVTVQITMAAGAIQAISGTILATASLPTPELKRRRDMSPLVVSPTATVVSPGIKRKRDMSPLPISAVATIPSPTLRRLKLLAGTILSASSVVSPALKRMKGLAGIIDASSVTGDDFGDDLSKWTQQFGTWAISSGEVERTDSGQNGVLTYSFEPTSGINHWAKAKIIYPAGEYPGLLLRFDPSETRCYGIEVNGTNVYWYRINKTTGAGNLIASTAMAHVSGNTLGARVTGTGNDTIVEVWNNPSGDTPDDWGAPDVTFTDNPALPNLADTGTYVGLVCWQGAGGDCQFDDFSGGSSSAVVTGTLKVLKGLLGTVEVSSLATGTTKLTKKFVGTIKAGLAGRIFSANIETGDLTEFDSTVGSEISASASAAHRGGYGILIDVAAADLNDQYVYEDNAFTEKKQANIRFYIRFANSFAMPSGDFWRLFASWSDSWGGCNDLNIYYDGSDYFLSLRQYGDLASVWLPGFQGAGWLCNSIMDGEWHCIEIHFATCEPGKDSGRAEFWVDGVSRGSDYTINNDTKRLGMFRLGLELIDTATGVGEIHFDSIEIDDGSYIGLIEEFPLKILRKLVGTVYSARGDILVEGFEGDGYENTWTEIVGDGSILDPDSIDVTPPNGGGLQVLKVQKVSPNFNAWLRYSDASEHSKTFTTFYVRIAAEGLSDGGGLFLAQLRDASHNVAVAIQLRQVSGNLFFRHRIYNNGGYYDYDSATISLDQWYRIDIKYDDDNNKWEWRIDEVIQDSGDLGGTHYTGIRRWCLGDDSSSNTVTAYFDRYMADVNDYIGDSLVSGLLKVSRKFEGVVLSTSSVISATLKRLRSLAGTISSFAQLIGDMSVLGAVTLSGVIDASATLPTPVLRVRKEMVGVILATSSLPISVLKVYRGLAGTILASSSVISATLKRMKELAGTILASSSVISATLKRMRTLVGTISSFAQFVGDVSISAAVILSGVIEASATLPTPVLKIRKELVGTINASATLIGDAIIKGTKWLQGVILATADLPTLDLKRRRDMNPLPISAQATIPTAILGRLRKFVGIVNALATVFVVDMDIFRGLAGTVSAQSTVPVAEVKRRRDMAPQVISAVATLPTPILKIRKSLAGVISALATIPTAALKRLKKIAGIIEASFTIPAPILKVRKALTGVISATAQFIGDVNVLGTVVLSGVIEASATLPAPILKVRKEIAGTISAFASLPTIALRRIRKLTPNVIEASATFSATLERIKALIGTILASAEMSGAMKRTRRLFADSILASATLSVTLGRLRKLVGTISASALVSGIAKRIRGLTGTIFASATMSGVVKKIKSFTGTILASATISGTLKRARAFAGTIIASAEFSGAMNVIKGLAGVIFATTTLIGDLSVRLKYILMSGVISATSTVSGSMKAIRGLIGTILATATLSGRLFDRITVTFEFFIRKTKDFTIYIRKIFDKEFKV